MAKKIKTDLDLSGNQLKNAAIENVTSDKSTSGLPEGAIFYNSTDKKLKLFNGTVIQEIGAGGTSAHSALTGLGDDDHAQYLNGTRHGSLDHAGATGVGATYNYPYVWVSHEVAKGTNSGSVSANTWQVRPLNTERSDVNGLASVASNRVTLAAGTWECYIFAQVYSCGWVSLRLKGIAPATTIFLYSSNNPLCRSSSPVYDQRNAYIVGRFTLANANSLEIQQYSSLARATNGFGADAFGGGGPADYTNNIFLQAHFWKIG